MLQAVAQVGFVEMRHACTVVRVSGMTSHDDDSCFRPKPTEPVSGDALGLCLGYGIFLKKDVKGDSRILAHEITHTLQFERFEGVREFLTAYIQEFLIYGYSAMPLEKEARSNEKLGTRILGK